MQFYISELLIRNPYERSISENSAAVAHAQQYLREFNGPDKILRALVEQINHERVGDALSNYVMNYGDVLTGPSTVDAAYTRDGWNTMMANIREHKLVTAGEPCVLGKEVGSGEFGFGQQNERDVQELYIKNYIQRWESFVGAHHVEPFRNTSDAAQKLKVLADNNRSPLSGARSHGRAQHGLGYDYWKSPQLRSSKMRRSKNSTRKSPEYLENQSQQKCPTGQTCIHLRRRGPG